MGANALGETANTSGHLIPGLPHELVLTHVLPRLPWYARPVCRAISGTWKAMLDRKNPELELKTREIQVPLLRGLFLVCTFDKQIFIRDDEVRRVWRTDAPYQVQPHWRKLPPLGDLIEPQPMKAAMVASSGMVYVWPDEVWYKQSSYNYVLKLDMGRGDWTWSKFSITHDLRSDVAVYFNGNIYAPVGASLNEQEKVVLQYDIMTDTCRPVETWYQANLRVLSKTSQHSEGMYCLVEQGTFSDIKVDLLAYDIRSDSWMTQEVVPGPEYQWSGMADVKLLNGDCFEPAMEAGMNVVWLDSEGEVISWFNSSLGMNWVYIDYNPFWEDKILEYMQFIRGEMYGIFLEEDQGEVEEQGGDSGEDALGQKRFIMKGRIIVADKNVAWEEVHEIGFFDDAYQVGPSRIQGVDHYTLMA